MTKRTFTKRQTTKEKRLEKKSNESRICLVKALSGIQLVYFLLLLLLQVHASSVVFTVSFMGSTLYVPLPRGVRRQAFLPPSRETDA